jgi:hypothetical protein
LDVVAKLMKVADGAALGRFAVGALEAIRAEIFEYCAVGEHVPDVTSRTAQHSTRAGCRSAPYTGARQD